MKVFNKIKNWFVEEYEDEEEEEEEIPVGEAQVEPPLARKVEVPKKSFRERFMHQEEEEEEPEVEEEKDIPLEITEVPVTAPPTNNRIVTLDEEEEFKPEVEEEKVEVPIEEEEEEEFPSRSTRIPLVFEDNDLFQEEEEESVPEPPREVIEKPLYQGKKESTYLSSMKKEVYREPVENRGSTKFRPSPIISPIYGILDKNYKKEEIVSREEKMSGLVDSSIDNVRKKAYGEPVKEEKKEEVQKEKKVNVNNEKPGVSKVTIADADEYYNDLGLAYNVDYKDMSRSNASRKKEEVIEDKNDDNLFDLIDSMYKKED